ncbi:hypothetical protein AAF712_014148 [Marasmius tenuissimus]|uniref:Uncharacterized protein n=1 Tax=Marasmius tenuissimus TaxID=585030 RepID=A0ABR2ZCU9_9AGAR
MRFITFFVVLSITSALAAPFKRDISTFKADIADIDAKLTIIDDTVTDRINSVNQSRDWNLVLLQVFDFDKYATAFEDAVKKATADTQAIAVFSEDDGKLMLKSFREIRNLLSHTLSQLAFKAVSVKSKHDRPCVLS